MRLPALLLPLAALAADERACTLKVAWWNAPVSGMPPVLTLEANSRNPREFAPQVMNFGTEVRCAGNVASFAIKRVSKDAKTGKDVVTWEPFSTVPLPPGDETIGVVMISDAGMRQGQARAFQMGEASFPLGSVRLVNLTGRELLLLLDGQPARAAPGGTTTHPRVFRKTQVAEIGVVAWVKQEAQPVFTTKSEFSPLYRLVLFVVETPGSNPPQFEVRTMVDFPQPQPKPPAPNGKSGTTKAGG